jgi:hypothetical protein
VFARTEDRDEMTGITDLRDSDGGDTERAARLHAGRPVIAERTSCLRSSGALGAVAIPTAELLHPAGRVKDARLPGVERVAR